MSPVPPDAERLPTDVALRISQRSRWSVLIAGIVVVLSTWLFQEIPALVKQPHFTVSDNVLYLHALLRAMDLLLGGLLAGWFAQPAMLAWLLRVNGKLTDRSRRAIAASAVALACVLVSGFLIFFGRRQFGSWDYGILIETGYRQLLGQRPYVAFAAPTPPFFNWTAFLAFRLFGVTWDANLFFAALFSSATLVWSYALLRRLGLSVTAALGTAFSLQVAAMLTCCFWWYNNSTLILAALFWLAAMLLLRAPRSRLTQGSFVVLLAILPLTKPNIAGLMLLGSLPLLLLISQSRVRVMLLMLLGFFGCVLLLLALHVQLGAMLATYHAIAQERGGLSAFGFNSLSRGEKFFVILWTALLCLPLSLLLQPFWRDLRCRRWTRALAWLLYPLTAAVSVYGLLGNGEYRDVEFPPLLCALALFAFRPAGQSAARRLVFSLLCGLVVSDLYYGAARIRVFTIAAHEFFEWGDDQLIFPNGFLAHVHGSRTLAKTDQEVRQVAASTSGSVFFGPRLDFEYAALHRPSPVGWASFFQPGTAFGREQTPALVQAWTAHQFSTLIFLKDEYPFFPGNLLASIDRDYIRDDHLKFLTVYRRRGSAQALPRPN